MLGPLYESALDPSRLRDFCTGLAQATGSHIGAIMVHDAQVSRGHLDLLIGSDPALMAVYEQEFAAENLWVQRSLHLMASGAVLDSDTIVPRSEFRRSRYYNECLRPVDVEQSIALCALRDAQGFVTATLCRSGRLKPYGEAELALVRRIAPHWVNAYAIHRRMGMLEQRATALEKAIDLVPGAMFLLDAGRRIVRTNRAAESLLSSGELYRSPEGLTATGPDAAAFRRCLGRACASSDGLDGRGQASLTLRDSNGRHGLVACVHPLAPMQAGWASPETAVLFIQPAAASPAQNTRISLRHLFGLTDAEAALADAFRVHADLAAAATACGISPGTAQTRLKLIYAKTGEHSQASLMRLMAAVAMASDQRL